MRISFIQLVILLDETIKKELEGKGHLLETEDYEMRLYWDNSCVTAKIFKKGTDRFGNHQVYTEDEVETLIQDLKDLSDWRQYRRLQNKLRG